MKPADHPFTIAHLAREGGVNVVRYYQRRGLMPLPARPLNGIRHYGVADADRLRFIKRSQAMGFTLHEIKNLLQLRSRKSCRATRALTEAKVEAIDLQIRHLRELRKELAHIVDACNANSEDSSCPALERLEH
jgi:MerR family transcriptional regulator, mercuric resistance operon regulatory protein